MTHWKIETHCHTLYSPDSITSIPRLIKTARARGLQRLIVTDHNTIRGALEAQAADPELIIVGEEVQTTHGEFLAAFVTREIPKYLTPQDALARLKDQGAFISVSHPFDPARSGWSEADLLELLPQVDALEIFNSRCFDPNANRQALEFARQHHIPGTAGSDAHTLAEVGRSGMMISPFHDPDSLRAVILDAKTIERMSSPMVHFGSMYARLAKAVSRQKD